MINMVKLLTLARSQHRQYVLAPLHKQLLNANLLAAYDEPADAKSIKNLTRRIATAEQQDRDFTLALASAKAKAPKPKPKKVKELVCQ